ncbi:MAG: PP2C family protein-serine/threonine phosphatase [Bacteroidetes bacterium]|nr:PP2C family protein-serine/threonine phosphatase [Bacteroidota bacterium]
MELDAKELQKRYYLKEMEINSLLEITQAINNNLDEDALFKIYEFTVLANLNISKLVLFVYDEDWQCKVNFGTKTDYKEIELPEAIINAGKSGEAIESDLHKPFDEFGIVVPVKHKNDLLALVLASARDKDIPEINTTFLQAISNLIIVAIQNQRLTIKQLRGEAFRRELEIAKEVQKLLFPENLPYGVRLKVEASYLPHQSIGGDYYDYIPINQNQFLICIADVSGKGIPAAIMMSNFQAALRTLIRTTPNLTEIVEVLNHQILENAKGENFITFFGAIYDHKLNTLIYVNAGHNPPILIDRAHGMRLLDEGCTVLGMFHPLPFINEGFITDLDSFSLFLYTDGVTETDNEQDEEYGSDRVEEFLRKNNDKDLKIIHKDLLDELDRFKGKRPYRDDITFLSCRLEER